MGRVKLQAVEQYEYDGALLAVFTSQMAASDATGISRLSITRCCQGVGIQAGGYYWRWVSDDRPVIPNEHVSCRYCGETDSDLMSSSSNGRQCRRCRNMVSTQGRDELEIYLHYLPIMRARWPASPLGIETVKLGRYNIPETV